MLELLLTYAHGLLAASSIGIVSFYHASIREEYALGPIAGGAIISMFSLCGAVGGVFAGSYLARTPLYRSLCIGSVLLVVSSFGSAVARSGWVFFALRLLASLGFIIIVTVVPLVVTRYRERRREIGLALWGAYLPLGIAMGNGMSALALRAWEMSWRSTIALHGAALILVTAALCAVLRGCPGAPAAPHEMPTTVASSARSGLRLLGRASFAYAAGFGAFTAIFLIAAGVLPSTLSELGGLKPAEAGVIASLVLALGGLGSLAALYLLPRVRGVFLLGVGFAGSALAAFGLYAIARDPYSVACFAVAIIVISGLIPATVFANLPKVADAPEALGPLNGLLTQSGCLGSFAAPPLLGWWASRFGYSSGWVPFAIICGLGFGLFMAALHKVSTRSSQ
jgi:MFS family permease